MKLLTFIALFFLCLGTFAQDFIIAGDTNLMYHHVFSPARIMSTSISSRSDTFSIDINNDGAKDLKFYVRNWYPGDALGLVESYVKITPSINCSIGLKRADTTFFTPYVYVANLLNQGDTIKSSSDFSTNSVYVYRRLQLVGWGSSVITDWLEVVDKMYLPVKIENNLGWIEVIPYSSQNYYRITINELGFSENMYNSVESNNQPDNLKVFPNPSTGKITISTELPFSENLSLRIFNANSQEIMKQSNIDRVTNVEIAESGVYFIEVKNNSATLRKKIVVIH
ncbi:MAG: T9SS type A sorting domain-containing protein [Bacteroidetes bacterium]|nr:T9SS type A sorting domain-containing protein [Bacteroidota bacterium]